MHKDCWIQIRQNKLECDESAGCVEPPPPPQSLRLTECACRSQRNLSLSRCHFLPAAQQEGQASDFSPSRLRGKEDTPLPERPEAGAASAARLEIADPMAPTGADDVAQRIWLELTSCNSWLFHLRQPVWAQGGCRRQSGMLMALLKQSNHTR